MTEGELAQAYRHAEGQLELEPLLASGVPVEVHGELLELRAQLARLELEVGVVRELVELIAAELEVAR